MAIETTPIPSKWIGPIACTGAIDGEINVPMATYETTLWPSTARGAKISRLAGGINLNVISDCMTRSVTLQAESASAAARGAANILNSTQENANIVKNTSSHATLQDIYIEQIPQVLSEQGFKKLDEVIIAHIQTALEKSYGRVEGPFGAAKLLGLNPSTLRSKIRKYGL